MMKPLATDREEVSPLPQVRLYPVALFDAGLPCDCGHADADHENEWGNPCRRCSCIHPELSGE